jgi:hypothetical protein
MTEETREHSFKESLARSRAYEDAPWWFDVYRRAFPGLRSAVSVRADGWAQRGGIDRVITLACGRTIKVDEKIREKVWPDILLERWSDFAARSPGWIQKPLACDFIAYAFVPIATCYLLPTLTLQRAWRLHGRAWADEYGEIRAPNREGSRSWVTVSVAVPIGILLAAINDAMRICWEPEEYDAAKDVEGSFNDAYAAIRERKANGGPGWKPKETEEF